MRKMIYTPSMIVLGLFLLMAGISLAPKPVFAGCNCSMTASAVLGTETICNAAKGQGAQCTYNSSGGVCNCSGTLPSITSSDQCNEDGARSAYGIPSIPGISYSANCSWSETGGDPNTSLEQQQLNPTSGSSGSSSGTPTTPSSSTTSTSAAQCDLSNYKAPGGLLADITHKECTACGQCDIADIFIVGNTVTKLILGLSGSIMLLMMIYGGFLLLTSGGSSGQIDKAKKVLVGAIIGLIIVFAAYTVVEFILGALGVPNAGTVFGLPFQTAKK